MTRESDEEIDARLRKVIGLADFVSFEEPFTFVETPVGDAPFVVRADALAVVRDDDVWSQLVPVTTDGPVGEQFALFRFHFPPGIDNSGFVGWLATHLKRELGTGIVVLCGMNGRRGGIFDYWGSPIALREQVRQTIGKFRSR